MPASIGFPPTPDDERILREGAQPGESISDTLRRALRLLDHERWLTGKRLGLVVSGGNAGYPQHRRL